MTQWLNHQSPSSVLFTVPRLHHVCSGAAASPRGDPCPHIVSACVTLFSLQLFSCDRHSGIWISVATAHSTLRPIQQMLPGVVYGRFTLQSTSPRCTPCKIFYGSHGVSSSVVEMPLSVRLQVAQGGGGMSRALHGPQERTWALPSSRGFCHPPKLSQPCPLLKVTHSLFKQDFKQCVSSSPKAPEHIE